MKTLRVALISLAFLIAACNCGASSQAPKIINRGQKVEATQLPRSASRRERRSQNKALTNHITSRTVHVSRDCSVKKGYIVLGTDNPNQAMDGRGTGIVVQSGAEKSYIFTAAHVVKADKAYRKGYTCRILVRPSSTAGDVSKNIRAEVLVYDDNRDVAVLVVTKNLGVSTELETEPFPGEDVWAAGHPLDMMTPSYRKISITKGTIASALVPTRDGRGHYHRVTSQVYYGNSGGGIWNKEGKLVGIVVALFTDKDNTPYEGYYYVKPVQEVLGLLKKKWKYWEVFGK